jgi:F-type H+/Na+-transporting ATPase subunit alpha
VSALADSVRKRLDEAMRRLETIAPRPTLDLLGRVESIGDDVAIVSGLPQARLNELLLFDRKGGGQPATGIVLALDPDLVSCAMLESAEGIEAGNLVRGTGSVAGVPVGEALLGRVVNPLGVPQLVPFCNPLQ